MKQDIYSVTLMYKEGSTWFAGEFNSLKEATEWIEMEKTRPYWDKNTQVQITNKETK